MAAILSREARLTKDLPIKLAAVPSPGASDMGNSSDCLQGKMAHNTPQGNDHRRRLHHKETALSHITG